jgi:glycosyltransferase involved in cell wall biosynthesis
LIIRLTKKKHASLRSRSASNQVYSMDAIDISVIIPTYHREVQLVEAIGSVLGQADVTFEVIVVDDSAEGSARNAVASVGDRRVHYIQRAEPSRGRPALVRNDGAKAAHGRYLYFLDDDDMLEPYALAGLSKALDAAPAAGMAFGAIVPFGPDEAKLRHHQKYFNEARHIARRLKKPRELSAILMFGPAILVCSACMARRSAFNEIGGFDADISVCEDAELWARISHATGFIFIDRPVVRYRTGAPSLMHDLAEDDERLRTSYRRIQGKYRQAHGLLKFLSMKLWARRILRSPAR